MKKVLMSATLGVTIQAFLLGVVAAEETATQTKTGIVKKVDTPTGQVVVMVTREMTFTVTESTKIVRADEAKKLADVQVGAKVSMEYTREGDTRTAKKIAILAGDSAGEPAAKQTDPEIKPGSTFTIKFPDMPPTFYSVFEGKDVKPQMTVFLPTDYDPGRKHPLLIFLSGGTGGTGGNPSVARALSEDRDFVCVSLPLFKEKVAPPAPGNGTSRILIRDIDCRRAWPLYREMLAKLEELVPNVDPAHQILGGFSNGAHATAGLIDESDGETARRFSALFFVEGGGKLQRYDLLRGKPFLMVYGSEKSQRRAREIFDAAQAAGAKATLLGMDGVGHAFPESEFPAVREWLRGPAME
jgi:dienelactone hydrolase